MSQKKRIFIAIPIPLAIREELFACSRNVSPAGLRWTPVENLHITLVFLGDTPIADIPQIEAKIAGITAQHPAFTLQCRAVETIKRRGKLSMIWAAVMENSFFTQLAIQLNEVFAVEEERAPRPHITLARTKRDENPRIDENDFSAIDHLQFRVDHIELWESNLTPQGSIYSVVKSWPLQE